jgi:hypothetical protein
VYVSDARTIVDCRGPPHLFTRDRWLRLPLRRSQGQALRPLPDETWVYQGHGNDTTLGTARPYLDEWCERGW